MPDVHVLALDTATAATAVTLLRVEPDRVAGTLAQRRHVDPRAHGERLAPMITEITAQAGVRLGDLTAIVAGTGPGPFTGLRVGLATAAAIGQALAVPTYGVCSLDGIGATAGPDPVLVATDARRREIYWALYRAGQRITEPAVGPAAQVREVLTDRGVSWALGEGARRYREQLEVEVGEHPAYPDPAVLASVALDRIASGAAAEPLTPRYLRRPDAAEPRPPKPVSR